MFELNDFSVFVGGWSYAGESLYISCKEIDANDKSSISVLEFGCGDSTVKLYEILTKRLSQSRICYDCYENDPAFVIIHPNIVCTVYHKDNIESVTLPSKKYDFVLVDGPHGIDRMRWYKKINHVIKEGTVILIDDWNHYSEFEDSLIGDIGCSWNYDIIHIGDCPTKSYKVVKITSKKSNNMEMI